MVKRFMEIDPVTAAHTVEMMGEHEAIALLKAIPTVLSANVFTHLDPGFAAELLKALPPDILKEIIEKLGPQQGAAIFVRLPQEIQTSFLQHLPEKNKIEIQELLTFPENSAGRMMSTDFLAFHADIHVEGAIHKIRSFVKKKLPISYIYVLDQENHLVGVMNMRDLILAQSDAPLSEIMIKNVFTVSGFMDREELAAKVSEKGYFAVPVVDSENRLLGVVKSGQLIEDVQEEATEDIQKMFGAGGNERVFSPVGFSLKKRLPWLFVNLMTAFLAAAVVGIFEDIIARITILAVFLPVVAGQGGNAGTQSLVVVIRGLVMREIPKNKVGQLIIKEAGIGVLNGISIGIVTALIAWFWHGNPFLGVVIGLAMIVNLFFAGLSGAIIPIAMKAVRLDPAQSSGIILTTVTDCVGNFSFLGFAVLFQHFLM
jgi:magnesium transporter